MFVLSVLLSNQMLMQSSLDKMASQQLELQRTEIQNLVSLPIQRVGVFLQVANISIWPEMFQCLRTVVEADAAEVGVHINTHSDSGDISALKNHVIALQKWSNESAGHIHNMSVHFSSTENVGLDIGPFLSQIQESYTLPHTDHYDVVLKMHSKSNDEWRRLGLQSLCGTKFHVRAILKNFATKAELGMIAPVGTVFSAVTPTSDIAPVIIEKYFQHSATVGQGAFAASMPALQNLFELISPEHKDDAVPFAIAAGSMYWVRYEDLKPEALVKAMPQIQGKLTRGYVVDGAIEHAIERFIPSLILRLGHSIAHMPSAPKVMAVYFPQFHTFPENDRFWGQGFTEWTMLQPDQRQGIRKPLSETHGGLGYYDLSNVNTRRLQGDLAKSFGVHGFMYYHYWFSGDGVQNHSVMSKVLQLMLQDGEPNLPFFFNWANEKWTRHWNGASGETLLAQEYGDQAEWQSHFEYLLPYFKHANYVMVDGKPVFAIYRPGHMKEKLRPMLELWSNLAKQNGFNGMYFVATVGNFYMEFEHEVALFDAGYHFMATCLKCDQNTQAATAKDLPYVREHHQFWGAFTGFDNRVRGGSTSLPVSPPMFEQSLERSFNTMGTYRQRRLPDNYFFAAAWNEWTEQNVMEPDDTYGFQYLQALQSALENITAVTSV